MVATVPFGERGFIFALVAGSPSFLSGRSVRKEEKKTEGSTGGRKKLGKGTLTKKKNKGIKHCAFKGKLKLCRGPSIMG